MIDTFEKKSLIECDLSYDDEFADWGLEDIAYVKKDVVDNTPMWSIYGAEGVRIGYAENKAVALAIISQHDLTAMSVH
ncbi:MAG: DUF1150 family protein [Alphaproteobacteria bacterium]|nr:DUF1150 family protein [Alphaproteobacteria bacterium]